jgi:hypothetical protein
VVEDFEGFAGAEKVRRGRRGRHDLEPSSAVLEPEGESLELGRESRREAKGVCLVAEAAETGDCRLPGVGERRDVETVARVVLEILYVDQRGFGEVVKRELEVADFGRDDRLCARRKRRVADCKRFVVCEVAALFFRGEGVSAHLEGEDEIGLLHDLFAVQVVVREVE